MSAKVRRPVISQSVTISPRQSVRRGTPPPERAVLRGQYGTVGAARSITVVNPQFDPRNGDLVTTSTQSIDPHDHTAPIALSRWMR
jgi:hypothetical protein